MFVCARVRACEKLWWKSTGRWIPNSLEFNKIELISSPLKREHLTMISFKVNERGFYFVEVKRKKVMSKRTKWKYKKNGMEWRSGAREREREHEQINLLKFHFILLLYVCECARSKATKQKSNVQNVEYLPNRYTKQTNTKHTITLTLKPSDRSTQTDTQMYSVIKTRELLFQHRKISAICLFISWVYGKSFRMQSKTIDNIKRGRERKIKRWRRDSENNRQMKIKR